MRFGHRVCLAAPLTVLPPLPDQPFLRISDSYAGEFYCEWGKRSRQTSSILDIEDTGNLNIMKVLNYTSTGKWQDIPNGRTGSQH